MDEAKDPVASSRAVVNEIRGLKNVRRKPEPFIQIYAKEYWEVCDFDDCAVEPHKLFEGHAVPQGHEQPGENVAWCDVGE
jgi:hypothetical protein